MAAKKEGASFEKGLARLEAIVDKLEADEGLGLEEALALFEEGARLADDCGKRLDAAEKRVSLLVRDRQQGLAEVPFATGDEAEAGEED